MDNDGDPWTYQDASDTWHVDDCGSPATAGFSFNRLAGCFGPLMFRDGSAATL